MKDREGIIRNYIEGYNQFNVDKMLVDFDEDVVFENIQTGEVNMSLTGLKAIRQQAEQAKRYFTTRTQTIKSFKHSVDETEVELEYYAILAMDFPNGLKRGDELKLKGKSIFKFLEDKVVELIDIS